VRLSPELEAAVLARATKVTTVNAAALGPAPLDTSPPPAGCSEEEFRSRIERLARSLGWEHYHTRDSRRSPEGFPDDVFGRERGELRLVVVEAKVPPNKPTEKQRMWLRIFEGAGVPALLVYPDQWAEVVAVLKRA
jgi:hypothetical protein